MTPEIDDWFQRLYTEHYDSVVGFLIQVGVPRDKARDLAQEAFLRVYQHMKGRAASPPPKYIYTTAQNVAFNWFREQRAQKRDAVNVGIEDVAEPSTLTLGPEAVLLKSERDRRVQQAIAGLPDGMRRALLLWLEGYRYLEIMAIEKTTIDGVKSRIKDAKARLRAELGDETKRNGDDEDDE